MGNTVNIQINNCVQCPHHEIIGDPDPYDSFCSDDMAVICKKTTSNPRYDENSEYAANRQNHRCVTVSCRPYRVIDESAIPNWCPLLTEK
jgi:hypothetical protein